MRLVISIFLSAILLLILGQLVSTVLRPYGVHHYLWHIYWPLVAIIFWVFNKDSLRRIRFKLPSWKGYFPFFLWGTWAGLAISLFPILLLYAGVHSRTLLIAVSLPNPVYWWVISECNEPGCGLVAIFSNPIVYFLYGWGIHSAFRLWYSKHHTGK